MTLTPVNPTGTSKDLGLAAAIVAATTPPTNQNILWLDTTQTPNVKKYYDFGSSQWLPLVPANSGTPPVNTTINVGNQTIFVSKQGNDFTGVAGNLALPFQTLSGAYAAAKLLNPTYQNRITIAVFPGTYTDSLTMDTDYISIVSAIPQETIYNDYLISTYTSQASMRRRCVFNGTIIVTCKNAVIKGIDVTTLTLKSWPTSDNVLANNIFENMICGTINNNSFGNQITGMFFDVHADSFLASDTFVNVINSSFIMCGGLAFRSGISTYASSTYTGATYNCYFDECWGGTGSFSGNGGYAYQTNFFKCVAKNNAFGIIQSCSLNNVVMGNNCVFVMNGGVIKDSTGGTGCVADFTNSAVIKDCDFGVNFGRTGTLAYLWGNIENVRSDFSTTGFCNNRNWYGKMRKMFIRTTTAGISGLTIYTPTVDDTPDQPSTVEYSTILTCYDDSTPPITGDFGYVSYCKFNKEISITNPLGADTTAYNIVNANLCNYVESVCAVPTGFAYTSGTLNTGAPITFVFSYQMSSTRAGSQIQMTDPSGQVSIINFTGNNGGSTTGTLNVSVETPIAGAYLFKLRTVCSYDGSGNATSVSNWTNSVTANVTIPSSRPTAWRAQVASAFCVLTNLSPQPLYMKLVLQNPQTLNNYTPAPGAGNYFNHTQTQESDLYVQFYSDSGLTVPVTLSNQSFVIYVKNQAITVTNNYTGSNTYPTSVNNVYQESINTYQLTNISGSSYLLQSGIQTSQYNESTYDNVLTNPLRLNQTITNVYNLFPSNLAQIGQTGYQGWNTIEQYYTDMTGGLTGVTAANISSNSNYIAPESNTGACSIAAPVTTIIYETSLIVNKVQFTTGSNVIIPSHAVPYDSTVGGQEFVVQRFLNQPTTLVINVNSYYTGTYTYPGFVICTIISDAGTQTFNLAKGVQTTVGTFVNITEVTLSDF